MNNISHVITERNLSLLDFPPELTFSTVWGRLAVRASFQGRLTVMACQAAWVSFSASARSWVMDNREERDAAVRSYLWIAHSLLLNPFVERLPFTQKEAMADIAKQSPLLYTACLVSVLASVLLLPELAPLFPFWGALSCIGLAAAMASMGLYTAWLTIDVPVQELRRELAELRGRMVAREQVVRAARLILMCSLAGRYRAPGAA